MLVLCHTEKGFTCKSLSDLMFTVKTAGFEVSGQVNDYDGYQGQINKHLERDTHRWTETTSTWLKMTMTILCPLSCSFIPEEPLILLTWVVWTLTAHYPGLHAWTTGLTCSAVDSWLGWINICGQNDTSSPCLCGTKCPGFPHNNNDCATTLKSRRLLRRQYGHGTEQHAMI